ncbi:nudix hydrolase 24, chloroplastic-like isoform X1 [Varroa jacobsoni]|uniref:nudix hydrolase 24, chloroplastic-like isoform X1 n=1 Tax=Varroa jacobsoni TaxID=62625 RepID=UPI000BF77391|nr:nudix hydrolase 24, chloroplastic-like isoform X1 [Varroa jacobsoni]
MAGEICEQPSASQSSQKGDSDSDLIMNPLVKLSKLVKMFCLKNTSISTSFKFVVNGRIVGVIRPGEWQLLKHHAPDTFEQRGLEIHLCRWKTEPEITRGLSEVLKKLRTQDVFPCLRGWRDELYEVASSFGDPPIFKIERAATFIFGTKRYGVDVNAFVVDDEGRPKFIWFQRRSKAKELFPSLLDIYVSGGLAAGESPSHCMQKECLEEASLPEEMSRRYVKPVSCVTYVYEDNLGVHPEISFCYDASLPADHEPQPLDGEVDEFIQMPLASNNELGALIEVICDPTKFKPTSVPIVIDFLIRWGYIDGSYGSIFLNLFEAIHQPLFSEYPPKATNST